MGEKRYFDYKLVMYNVRDKIYLLRCSSYKINCSREFLVKSLLMTGERKCPLIQTVCIIHITNLQIWNAYQNSVLKQL